MITGFLTGEGKTIAQGLLKQASNAGGERRLLQKTEIPLTGRHHPHLRRAQADDLGRYHPQDR